jgi:hypothetical protein
MYRIKQRNNEREKEDRRKIHEKENLKIRKEKENGKRKIKGKGEGERKIKGMIVGRYSKIKSDAFDFILFYLEMTEALYDALKFCVSGDRASVRGPEA